jgi:hypothetical protein
MTQSKSSFKKKGFDSYSAWTDFGSYNKQYKTLTQPQLEPTVSSCSPVAQASNPPFVIKVGW